MSAFHVRARVRHCGQSAGARPEELVRHQRLYQRVGTAHDGFAVRENRLNDGRCPACETPIAAIEMDSVTRRQSAA
jgi:hypothetical protein